MSIVIDACVAVKWYCPEKNSDTASKYLTCLDQVVIPDLLYSEFANTIFKKCKLNEINLTDARAIIDHFVKLPLAVYPSSQLINSAFEIAHSIDHPVYDCIYLALAVFLKGKLISADKKFAKKLKSFDFIDQIELI